MSPTFLRMIRDDLVKLLRSDELRAAHPYAADQRLARDLHELGGLAAAW